MLGLKTQENDKFNTFWEIVQKTAELQENKFFMECGEGREFFLDDMEGEDLRGWLIPLEQVDEFEPEWLMDNVSDKWIDNIFWAEWKDTDGVITVEFNTY
jgi:hypothetical protein